MDLYRVCLVGFGGFLGSVARYVASKAIDTKMSSIFPYGTLLVNVLGAFILGIVYTLAVRKIGITENWRIFLGAGFCGGFTTFSTFVLESVNLFEQKNFGTSWVYIVTSLAFGILAMLLGSLIARSL